MAAVSFGTASIGASIAGLGGGAAPNAAVALSGGGTLAAGGAGGAGGAGVAGVAGVAGGAAVLTGIVAAPAPPARDWRSGLDGQAQL